MKVKGLRWWVLALVFLAAVLNYCSVRSIDHTWGTKKGPD